MTVTYARQIVLDTETTGINKFGVHHHGHRIIEIGAIELINRRLSGRYYHSYIKPDRLVDLEAYSVHGINNEFLDDKPKFNQIADEFLNFIRGSELIIHNAAFDIGFINQEFYFLDHSNEKIEIMCNIIDTLLIARQLFPGKRNNLDALCNRYRINKSKRTLHGALLDAEILSEVYLAMSGGQTSIMFHLEDNARNIYNRKSIQRIVPYQEKSIKIIYANHEELLNHEAYLDLIKKTNNKCLWHTKRTK
ncbi:DNA polymerase III subunit epsilon [Candidatus Ecksteinia adelgidicola]|nr:DNA polymerase III subunit epsilon [Candidatus Ecksteinia adelgidicola]